MIKYVLNLLKYKYSSLVLILIFAISKPNNIQSQIRWTVADENYELYPSIIKDTGAIKITKGRSGGTPIVIGIDGGFTIYFTENKILFQYDSIAYLLKPENINEINLSQYGQFWEEELFKKPFIDSLQKKYRKIIYPELKFNEIDFSSSRRSEFELLEGKLILKNQKKQKGKICFINPQTVTLLTEEGDIIDFSNGDFNYLYFERKKMFTILELYNYFYKDYVGILNESRKSWDSSLKNFTIEELVKAIGIFDKSEALSQGKKIYSWKTTNTNYLINLTSSNKQITTNFSKISSSSFTNLNSRTNSDYSSTFSSSTYLSPIFLSSYTNGRTSTYGTSSTYATAYSINSLYASTLGITSTQGVQNGTIIEQKYDLELTIILDSNNSIIGIYNKNLFAEANYGRSFRFINF